MLVTLYFTALNIEAQNILEKKLPAEYIETITINGNQIFNISVVTTKTDYISISSKLDGEYQNSYQITTKEDDNKLILSLEFMSLENIPDDKRNAHKVIAATLHLEIPEGLKLNIKSDIGSVDLKGDYNTLSIELLQGHFTINGEAKQGRINTIDGNISVVTTNADVKAISNHGEVVVQDFDLKNSTWNLHSINGTIEVTKQQ
ncbi:hypothetical protein FBALC1_01657 [Flavobacteriales bacterium ALC-1]|nr:hypothetical protein FBALC1_01657 [Flavobacteriales bacterium ALC-1]